ncbi:hypothetical protein EDC04DRAFT_2904031 [Pisolithus marmoratus]|nr:hypothetical protein EDC04DRAFT_2904031 [Pisolithus marmoratus]
MTSGNERPPGDKWPSSDKWPSGDKWPGDRWPSEEDWQQGHHGSKSPRTATKPITPQVAQMLSDAERAAVASQASLLGVLNSVMFGGLQPHDNVTPAASLQVQSQEGTLASNQDWTPISSWGQTPLTPRPPLSSDDHVVDDNEQSTPWGSSRPLSELHINTTMFSLYHGCCLCTLMNHPQVLLNAHAHLLVWYVHPTICSDNTETESKVATLGEHQHYQSLPQAEFRAPGATLPWWPSTSIPSQPHQPTPYSFSTPLHASAPQAGPSVQPTPCDVPGPTSTNPQSHSATLAPLLLYFSKSLNSMFISFEWSQASSTKAIMEGISAIQEDLKASCINTNPYRDAEMQDIEEFPLRQARHPKKPRNFIPSDPTSDVPMVSDIAEHKYFSACIQLHALCMLKITDYKYLNAIKCALTEDEVEAYEQNIPSCIKVTPTNFTVDCARAKDMPYNCKAFMVFAEDFLDKVNNHGWYSLQTIPEWYCNFDVIYGAFKMHFAYIKSCYNDVIVAPSKDPVKAKEDMKARLCKSSCTSRKLLKMHLNAMAEQPKLQKHLPLVKYLSTQGMSSDESEDETRRMISYPHVYPCWHSQQLSALMWEANLAILEFLSVMIGKHKKAGMQFWNCPHSDKFNDVAATPPRLPVNCYNPAWLSLLHPHSKKELRVQEKEYNFDLGLDGKNRPAANTAGPSTTPSWH